MSHLEGLYLTQLRQRERDELDAWMAERLQQPRQVAPGAATPPMGIGEEFTRGVVRGGANVAGSLGTLLKAGGALTGSNMLSQAGESMATYWSQVVQRHAPSEEAQQSLWDNPTAVLNPRWLTASVAESIPSLAAAMVPAAGAGAALSIGGRLIGWTPAVALKLARIGAAVTGGVIGGGLEGAQTFEEVKRRGGSDEEALKALAFMGLASAGLNALSLGQAFKTPARAGLLPLAKRVGMAGVSEGLTEWLEEPTEAVILGEDWNGILEAGKRGLNVIPAAALTGGAANVAVGAAKGAGAAAPVLATERGSMTLEDGGSAAGEPQAAKTAKIPQPPLWQMSPEELDVAYETAQDTDRRLLRDLFGEQGAKEYERLQRRSNSVTDLAGADQASKRIKEMEGALSREKQNRLFGIGEANVVDPEDVREFRSALGRIDGSSAEELGRSLQWAITKVPEGISDPAQMTPQQQIAYAQIRYAFDIAKQEGYDTTAVTAVAIRGAASRFTDPADAVLMLRRFIRSGEQATEEHRALGVGGGGQAPPGVPPLAPPGETPEEGGSAAGEQATEAAKMPQLGETLTVNLKYIDGDRELKAMTAAINRLNAERMAEDRATKSVDTMRQRGRELLPTLDAALEWNPVEAPFKDVEGGLRALADWRDTATQHFDSIHAAALKGDPEARARYHQAWTLAYGLAAKVELGDSIAGRTLRMQQELSSPNEGSREELMALADTMRDASDTNLDAFIARVDVLKKRQRNVMGRQSINFLRAGLNALYEAWINALLSGPQTLVAVNPISNALTMLGAISERAIAAQLHTSTDVGVVKGEATAMLRGIVEGFLDGLRIARLAWEDFETGGGAEGFLTATKLDLPKHAITAGAFGQDPNGSVGRALDLLGAGVRFPSRFMASTDAFFKAVNYRMELKALALREAIAEGLDGKALVKRVAQIEANPGVEIKERAEQFMLLQTFQNDLGDAGKALMKLRDASGIGRLIIPFLKTPTNIAKWVVFRTIATPVVLGKFGAERTLNLVGLNSLANSFRSELSEPGPIRDLALARMSLGALLGASVAALAGASLITGGGPSDPDLKRQLRETGWQPYSFKIGDTYYSYNRLDPIGAAVGLVADTSEIVGQLPEVQADSLVAAVVLSLSKTMINKTYMQGLADAIEAISNPERGATKYAQSFARTLIPTAVRTLERTVDPTLREARTVLESMQASVPGWSASLPARRNLFGEPIMLQGGLGWDLVSPIYTSTIKDDAGAAELARHRVDISMPSRVLEGRSPALMRLESRGISGVELSGQEYSDYIRLAGEGLRDELNRLVASPSYAAQSDGPDGGKALLLRQIIYAYRQVGRARLLSDNTDIQRRHVEYLERRATALLAGSLGR